MENFFFYYGDIDLCLILPLLASLWLISFFFKDVVFQ